MNILLINHYAGSPHHGMEYRPYYLAREWVKSSHRVKIIASSESHLRSHSLNLTRKLAFEEIDGIEYVWLKTPGYRGNGFKRVVNLFAFARALLLNTNAIMNGFTPDLVIASSPHPFIIRGARRIANKSQARLVFEVRDLWPLSLIELNDMPTWHPFIIFMQHEEDYAYKYCDKVASLLPLAKEYMINRGMHESKFFFSPNGVVTESWAKHLPLSQSVEQEIKKFKLKNQCSLLIGFSGSHGIANALDSLIDVAKLLRDTGVGFILVGKGDEKIRLINYAKSMDLKNVLFLDEIDKEMVSSFLSLMDVLYIGLKNHSLFRFGVSPNKLFDYMMSGKPIVYAINSGNDPVLDAGCGVSCAPENAKEICKAILKIKGMSERNRIKLGQMGYKYVLENHDYSILAKKYLEAIS